MNLPKTARDLNNNPAPISNAAFQRTVGNQTATYIFTLVTSDKATAPLSGAASKVIIDSLDLMCGTVDNTVGTTKILCLSNGNSNPCAALASPSAVAQIVTGSQDGVQVCSAVVNKGLFNLQQPWHQNSTFNFEKCMFGAFEKAIQAGLSLDAATGSDPAPSASSAPAHSSSAPLKSPPKKSAVVLCALIGVSVLMGTI
jgi:hypothetical protein